MPQFRVSQASGSIVIGLEQYLTELNVSDIRNESSEFIESLKQAGIAIHNEHDVVERLAEAREWHSAFLTLVRAGKRIGIWFARTAALQSDNLQRLFAQFRFSPSDEIFFEAALEG